jgi:hypothetical protein
MRPFRLSAFAVVLLCSCAHHGDVNTSPDGLFEQVFNLTDPGTKQPVRVTVREVKRVGDVSTLTIDAPPGLGRAEGMLFLRAVCNLRSQRSKPAFDIENDQLDRWTFHVKFLETAPRQDTAKSDRRVLTASHCAALSLLPSG